jgi:hypothetical protein
VVPDREPRGYWSLGFTAGLVCGIGIVALLVLLLDTASPVVSPLSGQPAEQSAAADHGGKNGDERPNRLYWPRRLISFEDTFAQWTMMIFTVAAAALLLQTLKTTRRIGQAQVRAYLTVAKVTYTPDPDQQGTIWHVGVTVRNSGLSPAMGVVGRAYNVAPALPVISGAGGDIRSGQKKTIPLMYRADSAGIVYDPTNENYVLINTRYTITFVDVFDKLNTVEFIAAGRALMIRKKRSRIGILEKSLLQDRS